MLILLVLLYLLIGAAQIYFATTILNGHKLKVSERIFLQLIRFSGVMTILSTIVSLFMAK